MGIFNKEEYGEFGVPLEAAGITGIGSILGAKLNHYANKDLQERQFAEQERLQKRAFQMNEQAVRNQAENMKLGMENAGLNPASVNGAGAPSIQAGAAAGSTSQLANIFTGVAEMIQAAKAPTEIEKMVAETGKTEAEEAKTRAETSAIAVSMENMQASTKRLSAETQNLKNMNEVFQARNEFIKDIGASVFDGYRGILQGTGQWDKLNTRTRNTINMLADGEIDLDIGAVEALDSLINTQANLSERDAEVLHSMLDSIVTNKQLQSESIKDAIAKMPRWQQNLMRSQITEYYAMASQAKTAAEWNKTQKWIDEHTSDVWLIEHGMEDEIERKKYAEYFNRLINLPFNVAEGALPTMAGASILRGKPKNNKPLLKEIKNTVGKKQNKTTYTYEKW